MLVISAAAITYTEKEYEVLSAILNDWTRRSKVELEITYYPISNDFSSCYMRDFHIVFVDVSMEGDQNGLSSTRTFKRCSTKSPIVLFPGGDRHLMDNYEINTLYLTKTFKRVDIEHCTERIFETTSNANFKLRFEDTTLYTPHNNILYIQNAGEESLIIMREGSYKPCLHLEELDYALPGQFIWYTTHTPVSIKYIRQIEKKELLLWNDEQLEINPGYRQAVVLVHINKASQGELIMVEGPTSRRVDYVAENRTDKEQRAAYVYGLTYFINELFSNTLLLAIAPSLNKIWQIVVWMMVFDVLRFNIGGYHTDTPVRYIIESTFIGIFCTLAYPLQAKDPYSSV